MKKLLFITLASLALGTHLTSFAQPGALDLSFDPGPGPNGQILSTAIQSDGKIIIGGVFGVYNGTFTTCLARLNTNGSLDTTFHVGIPPDPFPFVYAIAIQPDGKIIIGGGFTSYDGTTCKRLARLNMDGSYDMNFNTTVHGANGSIEAIALQPDGKIIIGGDFTVYDTIRLAYDTLCWRVARVNADGSRDTSFVPALGAHSVVHTLAVQPDSSIIIGGNFSTYNFEPLGKITRIFWDAWIDSWFKNNSGTGFNNHVFDVELMSNGKILVAGNYTTHNGTTINRIARLESYGVLDSTFNSGTGADWTIYAVKLQSNGKIIIAGDFVTYNGTARKRIARLYNCLTPQPASISGRDSTLCSDVFVYSVPPVTDADSYEWTLPAGWSGTSDSTSIIATSNGQGGVISVRAFSDSCGFSEAQTKTIYRIPVPAEPICLVTVDDSSTHNILIWEKIETDRVDSFLIYRETATNVYTKIASAPYDSLSEYHDYAANPNTTSYRYKISSLDTCGVETALSPFHSTIHLQNLGLGNFQWTFYDIEDTTNPVDEFNIYRDPYGTGNFFHIGTIPGTNATFTDISYASFPNSKYVVDVNWRISCTPKRASINTTRSNIKRITHIDTPCVPPCDTIPNDTIPNDTTQTGLALMSPESFIIYPNPTEGTITLYCPSHANIRRLQLFNAFGQKVWSEEQVKFTGERSKIIQVATLPKGVYILAIETNAGRLNRKVII